MTEAELLVMSADIELDRGDDIHEVWRNTLADLFEYMGNRIRVSSLEFTGTLPEVTLTYEVQRWDAQVTLELKQ
jgi:hypothetical protein